MNSERRVILGISALVAIVIIGVIGYMFIEKWSFFDSLYMKAMTLTTVGYGDTYPVTIGGKVFTFFVLMLGLGVVAVPSGLMAAALSEARRLEGGSGPRDEG